MRILTHDQLYRTAPAVFASQPDEAVSDRYGFVPTITVVDALQAVDHNRLAQLQIIEPGAFP